MDSTEISPNLPYTASPTDPNGKRKQTHAHKTTILHNQSSRDEDDTTNNEHSDMANRDSDNHQTQSQLNGLDYHPGNVHDTTYNDHPDMADRDSDDHQAQSQLDSLDRNPDNVQVQDSQLEDQAKISTGTNTIALKRKRASPPSRKRTSKPKPGATSDEVADTEDLPEYNREITDVLCTLGDRFQVEDWIGRHLQSWKRALEKKRKVRKITGELPVYTSVSFTDSVYQIPLPGVKLSDEHVYLISKHLSINDRKGKWPEDFNSAGDLLANRIPTDPAPLFYAWGIPFIAVFRGYLILCGMEASKRYGTSINVKNGATTSAAGTNWLIGPVIADTAFVTAKRNLTRTYYDETGENVTTKLLDKHFDTLFYSEDDPANTSRQLDKIATRLFDFSLFYNSTKLDYVKIAKLPTYDPRPARPAPKEPEHVQAAPSQPPQNLEGQAPLFEDTPRDPPSSGGQLTESLLAEIDPEIGGILEGIRKARAPFPSGVNPKIYPEVFANGPALKRVKKEAQAIRARYTAQLESLKSLEDRTTKLRPLSRSFMGNMLQPLRSDVKHLTTLISDYFGDQVDNKFLDSKDNDGTDKGEGKAPEA